MEKLMEEQTNTRMNLLPEDQSVMATVERAIEAQLEEKAKEISRRLLDYAQQQLRAELLSSTSEIAIKVRSYIQSKVMLSGDTIHVEIRLVFPEATKR
jgi:predicted Zn-dependent peptidase